MELSSLSDDTRQKFAINDRVAAGVVVTGVDQDFEAAAKHIQAGDVILEINQEPVKEPADIAKKIPALKSGAKKSALLFYRRQGRSPFRGAPLTVREQCGGGTFRRPPHMRRKISGSQGGGDVGWRNLAAIL
jgi:S1-C subfamily serine protease